AGEDPRDAAIRELAEETGYVAESVEFVRAFVAEPSNSQVLMHVFLARNARLLLQPQPDVTEDIQVERCTIPQLRNLVAMGEIEALSQVAAIYFILENILKTPGLSN
ncbi:MAG: NUDIX hydrolase, partial [Candidatus Baltobacteraceae bacterium]